jgi:tetratricopeptide (TPR) repeat protein
VLAGGTLITLALYILARLSRGNIILPPLSLIGALWLPVIAFGLSTAFSGAPLSASLWGFGLEPGTLGLMAVVTILGTLTALVARRSENYVTVTKVMARTFLALIALQILIIIVGQFKSSFISPAFSLVGSLSDLAFVLGLGLIGTLLALRELELSRNARRALIAGIVGALVLLAVIHSVLVWTLVAIVSLGFFVESVMLRGASQKNGDLEGVSLIDAEPASADEGNRSLALPLIILIVSLFFLIGGTLGSALAQAVGTSETNVRPSWQATLTVGKQALSSSPVFGSGPGTFGSEWLKHRDASLNATQFWNVDFSSGIGFVPTSFATTGVVGIVAWIVALALFLIIGLRMLIRRTPEDAVTRYTAIFSFLGTAYLFVIAIADLPSALVLTLGFVFMGLFASTMRFARGGEQWGVAFSRSPRLGFVIVFTLTIVLLGSVVTAYSLVERFVATVAIASANVALSNGNLDMARSSIDRSVAFAPSALAYQVGSQVAFARLNEIVSSTTMPTSAARTAFQDTLSAGITSALTASTLAPSDYRNWLALGNLYAQAVPLSVEGAFTNAKTAYEKAQALNPTDPRIPYILAQLAVANKDAKSAETYLKSAIALKQDYTTAIFLLSQLQVQDGNVTDALNSALAAAYFTPNNPNILFQVGVLYAAKTDYANAELALRAAVDANTQFANARYFLAAVLAKRGNMAGALEQVKAIAALSPENATAVATQLASLEAGKNPFPANLLTVSTPAVQ